MTLTSLAPILVTDDMDRSVRFYVEVLGFTCGLQTPGYSNLQRDAVRIMLTGNVDQQTAVDAVNRGHIFRFLHKPFRVDGLIHEIELGIKHYEMLRAERELLEGTLMGSVKAMSEVIGLVAPSPSAQNDRPRMLSLMSSSVSMSSTVPSPCQIRSRICAVQ